MLAIACLLPACFSLSVPVIEDCRRKALKVPGFWLIDRIRPEALPHHSTRQRHKKRSPNTFNGKQASRNCCRCSVPVLVYFFEVELFTVFSRK